MPPKAMEDSLQKSISQRSAASPSPAGRHRTTIGQTEAMTKPKTSLFPMLDFSFCSISDPTDIYSAVPRAGKPYEDKRKPPTPQPGPQAGGGQVEVEEEHDRDGRSVVIKAKTKEGEGAYEFKKAKRGQRTGGGGAGDGGGSEDSDDGSKNANRQRYLTGQCKLANNSLSDITGIAGVLQAVVVNAPKYLTSIDFSFNQIHSIPEELGMLPLSVLYLHANAISDGKELEKLKPMTGLYSLTLHGNPLEGTVKQYKHHVLWLLPKLKSLDFSAFTKRDRETVETYVTFYRPDEDPKDKKLRLQMQSERHR